MREGGGGGEGREEGMWEGTREKWEEGKEGWRGRGRPKARESMGKGTRVDRMKVKEKKGRKEE